MKQSYFRENGIWLKGNIHCHTTVSDGVLSPDEIAATYASHGYDFLAMTDHNTFKRHVCPETSELLLLTGVEHDLAYSKTKCIHVVGIGSEQERENTQYECRKYAPKEMKDQELIDMMQNDGQFTVLAHPIWSRMEPEEVIALHDFHAMEVYNNGAEHLCHAGHAEIYWDMLLRRGMKVFGVATDDTHGLCDLFGGWICVKAKEKSYQAVVQALFEGNFYASSGPVIHDFGIDGDKIYLSCSPCREIHFVTYPARGESCFAEQGTYLEGAEHLLQGGETYVRAECIDDEGRAAWTNPIFFDGRR